MFVGRIAIAGGLGLRFIRGLAAVEWAFDGYYGTIPIIWLNVFHNVVPDKVDWVGKARPGHITVIQVYFLL